MESTERGGERWRETEGVRIPFKNVDDVSTDQLIVLGDSKLADAR